MVGKRDKKKKSKRCKEEILRTLEDFEKALFPGSIGFAPVEDVEREEEKDLVASLIGELRRGGLGVAGIDNNRSALTKGQVDTIIISKSIDSSNIEELTSLAKKSGAGVEFVPGDDKMLAGIGGVGALLRYSL